MYAVQNALRATVTVSLPVLEELGTQYTRKDFFYTMSYRLVCVMVLSFPF